MSVLKEITIWFIALFGVFVAALFIRIVWEIMKAGWNVIG